MCADKRQRLQIECTTNGMTFTLAMYSLCALRPALVTRAFFHLLCRFVPYAMGKLALQFDHLCVCVCVCVCVCARVRVRVRVCVSCLVRGAWRFSLLCTGRNDEPESNHMATAHKASGTMRAMNE
jgi:hypothetical protein